MKHKDILYGLEIVIFNHPRKEWHNVLLDKLQDRGYIDWYGWYDEEEEKYKYQINATHKGLIYYATKRSKRNSNFFYILSTIILLIPYLILLVAT
jgi:hypothetical protein